MKRALLVALGCLLALPGLAFARIETIAYDDGDTVSDGIRTTFPDLVAGDIESVRFTATSPCRINSISLKFQGDPGEVEVHFWADDGTGRPDLDTELAPPVTVTSKAPQVFTGVALDPPVEVDARGDFHVGVVKLADDPDLESDTTPDCLARSQQRASGTWRANEAGDYFIRATVDWFDEPTAFAFEDVAAEAGITGAGGRVAWCDLDNDGYDDLCTAGLRVFANRRDGTFRDVTDAAVLTGIPASGCVCADYDNDGWIDLFAALNSLTDYDRVLHNNGDGTFTDVTTDLIDEADLDFLPTEGAAWGDLDNDGFVDLYLANYEVIDPEHPDELGNCTQDKLYYNRGGTRFQDVALATGIDEGIAPLCGRGVAWGDYDNDGDLDIYVGNYRLDANYLWENKGGGRFEDVARDKGVQGTPVRGAYGHTIGSAWADFNDDGYLDLIVLNLAHPRFIDVSDISALYLNQGPPDFAFVDVIAEAGIFYHELHSNPSVGDMDNDGVSDILITTVYAGSPSFLFRGLPGVRFEDVTYDSGIRLDNGWGSAWSDYDNDGDLDLAAYDRFGRMLWRNRGTLGAGNHWLTVRTFGTTANRGSIGTRVAVTVGDRTMTQVVSGGSGTTCQDSAALHFGLGAATAADRIQVTWLGGGATTLTDVAADQILTVTEGGGEDSSGDDDGEAACCGG